MFKTSLQLMVALFPDAILDALSSEGPNEERSLSKEEFDSYYNSNELNWIAEYCPCDKNDNQFTFLFCTDGKQNKFYVVSSEKVNVTLNYFISIFDNIEKTIDIIEKVCIKEAAKRIVEFFNTKDDNEVYDYIKALEIHSLPIECEFKKDNSLVNMKENDLYKIMYSEDDGLLYIFNKYNNPIDNKKYIFMTSLAEAYCTVFYKI